MNGDLIERLIGRLEARARVRTEQFAGEFVRGNGGSKEAALAALEFERWFAQTCAEHLDGRP